MKKSFFYPIINGNKYSRIVFVSDIHGYYDSFVEMRRTVELTEMDLLVISGDLFDRGPESIELWRDVTRKQRYDTCVTLGNHEKMLFDHLAFEKMIFRNSKYLYNTVEQLEKCSMLEIKSLIKWIRRLPQYIEIKTPNTTFAVAHACTLNPKDKHCCIYGDDNIVGFYTGAGVPGKTSICGHYSTNFLRSMLGEPMPCKGDIFVNTSKSIYDIDCGCGYRDEEQGGCLGVLCYDVKRDTYEMLHI